MKLEVITGPMFSGKSEELIRRVKRSAIAGQKIQVFKPSIDVRRGVNLVSTHDHINIEAYPVTSSQDIFNNLRADTDIIFIDELQFFDDRIIDVIDKLVRMDVKVVVACLNLDFRGEPFPFKDSKKNVSEVILRADTIDKLSSICTQKLYGKICGRKAVFNQRIIDDKPAPYDSPTILIGAQDSYVARCRRHFKVPGRLQHTI